MVSLWSMKRPDVSRLDNEWGGGGLKRSRLITTWRTCPQVLPGLQGHPSAGGHGRGYPDGELVFTLKNSSFISIFSSEYQQQAVFLPR